MSHRTLVKLLLALVFLTLPVTAGVILGGHRDLASDSFTLTSDAEVIGVDLDGWLLPDTIDTVNWSIGTTPYGADSGSGTAVVSGTSQFTNDAFINVDVVTFSIPSSDLSPGTYYLTLQYAVVPLRNPALWAVNNGPSAEAWLNGDLRLTYLGRECLRDCALSLQTMDDPAHMPEPSTWVLLGSGILATFALRRKAIRR